MTTRRLRVAFLDHTTMPGGAELALARVVRQSPENVRSVVVVPRSGRGVFDGDPRITCVEVGPAQPPGASAARGLHGHARFVVGIVGQVLALRINEEFRKADVVVANTSRAAVYGYLARFGTRKTFVIHVRDEVDGRALGAAGFLAMRRALRAAHVVIGNSQHTIGGVEPLLRSGTRRYVIPSPIGVNVRSPWIPEPTPVQRVGMVSRIEPWKGHELLLRAFARAFGGLSEVGLYLAGGAVFGEQSYLDRLRTLATDLDVGDRVHFQGHVSDVSGFVDDMDICVQCSLRPEPLGQNVLQYLARRRPVIATAAGGPTEWVVHGLNGLLFAPGDADALTDALQALAADWPLRKQIMSSVSVCVSDDASIADQMYHVLCE